MSLEVLLQAVQYVQERNQPLQFRADSSSTSPELSPRPSFSRNTKEFIRNDYINQEATPESDVDYCRDLDPCEESRNSSSRADVQDIGHSASHRSTNVAKDKERGRGGKTKGSSESRSSHNVLEKNRRAHLKDCFNSLKAQVLDAEDDKKASHLTVLKSAVRCIKNLQSESERLRSSNEKLIQERQVLQQHCAELKREVLFRNPNVNLEEFLARLDDEDESDSQETCTAPAASPHPRPRSPKKALAPDPHRWPAVAKDIQRPSSADIKGECRKRSPPLTDACQTSKPRKQVKIVSDILQEYSEPESRSLPASRSSSPRTTLPIRLRILQDREKGLFLNERDAMPIDSPPGSDRAAQNLQPAVPLSPYSWPDGFAAVPVYSAPQLFSFGQFIVGPPMGTPVGFIAAPTMPPFVNGPSGQSKQPGEASR